MAVPGSSGSHPGNDYYVNDLTGTIQRQGNALLAKALLASGWTGPYTWAEAKGLAAGLAATGATNPSGAGATPTPTSISGAAGTSGLTAFLARLSQASTWLRVAEVLLGVVLLAVGIARITNAVPIATQIAGAVK